MSPFPVIVITKPVFFDGEAETISRYVRDGMLVHVRKPGATVDAVERLLMSLPADVLSGIVLHDAFELASKYGVYGVHLNSRNPQPPQGWGGSVSRSCHSFDEVEEWKHKLHYVSLSPIFDSISKQGYQSAFTREMIDAAVSRGVIDHKVYALGGVTFNKIEEVKQMGFGGTMILGDAWKD